MAELVIKTWSGCGFAANDVMQANSRRRIRWYHAQHICHPRRNARTAQGLCVSGSIVEDWFDKTCSTIYQRVSQTELRRYDRWKDEEFILNSLKQYDDPRKPGTEVRCRVAEFFARAWTEKTPEGYPKLPMFGSPGAEYFYGGRKRWDHTALDLVWAVIEAKTAHREVDYPDWPHSSEELCKALVVKVADFDEATETELVAPQVDGETVLAIRKKFVDWQTKFALPQATIDKILDPTFELDGRSFGTFQLVNLVEEKS